VGPTPAELESLNELIKFDHIYYKTDPVKAEATADSSEDSDVQIVLVCDKSGNEIHVTDSAVKSNAQPTPVNTKSCKRLRPKTLAIKSVTSTGGSTQKVKTPTQQCITDAMPNMETLGNSLVTVGSSDKDGVTIDLDNLLDMITNDSAEHEEIISEILSEAESTPQTVTDTVDPEPPVKKSKVEDNLRIEDELGLPEDMFLPYSPLSSTSSAIDSGFGSDIGEAASPKSETSTCLSDNVWEESFTDLFPSLL